MNSPRASSPASEALESRHGSDDIPEPGDNEPEPIPSVSRIEDVRTLIQRHNNANVHFLSITRTRRRLGSVLYQSSMILDTFLYQYLQVVD